MTMSMNPSTAARVCLAAILALVLASCSSSSSNSDNTSEQDNNSESDIDTPGQPRNVVTIAAPVGIPAAISNACAPSNDRERFLNLGAIDQLLSAGYAVLAPDYEGFRSDTIHPYFVRASHANAILDALPAAHAIEGSTLSDNWAIVGHSQGGHVALATASCR